MRTLNVCLLASSISFNALATDISMVVDTYDCQQPIHKHLKYLDTEDTFKAMPLLLKKRYEYLEDIAQIKREIIQLANSKKIKNTLLNYQLLKLCMTRNKDPFFLKALYRIGIRMNNLSYNIDKNEYYKFNTKTFRNNAIQCCINSKTDVIRITDYTLSGENKVAITSTDTSNKFDDESAYFIEQSILKEAIKLTKNVDIINFSQGFENPNTIIAVDIDPETSDFHKNHIYDILLHYTIPGILNRANIANFKYELKSLLKKPNGPEKFDRFISHPYINNLIAQDQRVSDLYQQIIYDQLGISSHQNARKQMIDTLADHYLITHNNHIIGAYLYALGGINNILFVPKTLYQLITLECLTQNFDNPNLKIKEISFNPTFQNIKKWAKAYDTENYQKYIHLLSLVNSNVIKYTQNRSLKSIVYKTISKMKKNGYISETAKTHNSYWINDIKQTNLSRIVFAEKNTYTPLSFYNVISELIFREYNAEANTWRVYHGGLTCPITNDFSSSFSDGLFSGSVYDAPEGCAGCIALGTKLFYCDIKLAEQNTNFYIPAAHTILPMFGQGELHHVRTKVFPNVGQYETYSAIKGFTENFDDLYEEKILVAEYPMLFTNNPYEFNAVKVSNMTEINTNITRYIVHNKTKE